MAQVGNGDVVSVAAARKLVQETGCGAIMVGRGAVTDPFLFWRIRASYERPDLPWEWDEPEAVQWFLRAYAASCLKAPAPASPVLLPNGQKQQQQQQQQGELEAVLEEDGVSTSGRAPSDGLPLDGNLAMVGAVMTHRGFGEGPLCSGAEEGWAHLAPYGLRNTFSLHYFAPHP